MEKKHKKNFTRALSCCGTIKQILKKFHVCFNMPNKLFFINNNVKIEGPSTINGVDLRFPFFLGAFTHINEGGFIQNCTIGRYCAIGTGVKIGNGNHPTDWLSINACQYISDFHDYNKIFNKDIKVKKFNSSIHTTIGNDVWIGANVFIKDGIEIGNGAIIGANSVVTHNVEPYSIVAGAPAKLLRYRFSPEIISQLQDLKWWEYNIEDFDELDFDDIENAIYQLKIKLPTLKKYEPKVLDAKLLRTYFPSNIQLCGLLKTYNTSEKKIKKLLGIKLYEKKIKEKE